MTVKKPPHALFAAWYGHGKNLQKREKTSKKEGIIALQSLSNSTPGMPNIIVNFGP